MTCAELPPASAPVVPLEFDKVRKRLAPRVSGAWNVKVFVPFAGRKNGRLNGKTFSPDELVPSGNRIT